MKKIIILIMIMMVIFSCTNTIVEDKDSKDSPEAYVPFVPVDPNPVIVNQQVFANYQIATQHPDGVFCNFSSIIGNEKALVTISITDSNNVTGFCNYVLRAINNTNGEYIYYSSSTNMPIIDENLNVVTQILTDEQGRIGIWGGSTTINVWYFVTLISYVK
jgi:PBP1b-binding outer membrane lipoprotein LpoB